MAKSLYFTKYKSGILELVFTFKSKNFSECNLLSDEGLLYKDLIYEEWKVFEFPKSVCQGYDLRKYCSYENTNKDQFVITFIPQEMLIGEKDPSEVIELETEYCTEQKDDVTNPSSEYSFRLCHGEIKFEVTGLKNKEEFDVWQKSANKYIELSEGKSQEERKGISEKIISDTISKLNAQKKETIIDNEFKGYNPDTVFLPDNHIKETTVKDELREFVTQIATKSQQ